ncbi:MAG: ABC-F family ATP-binding cassette domain-containing protein [Nitrospirae bacterium]|nr:ABC-F family ATP-binding cassette domain-containing protein [Nitrospirota bacterium]
MIQVNDLTKTYGEQVIFDRISFTVHQGERIGLVGRNGQGKTTLFRLLHKEEHPDSGVIRIPNCYTIGHLSQHIRFSEDTVLKEACLGLRPHDDGRDETYKVETVLQGLGFSQEDFLREPGQLSGGFQVRLNLAKVLLNEPNLLLLDEPTNYLDILSVRWLIQFLRSWKNEMILITHDRDFMDSVTTHTMGIHRNTIRKISGPTHKLYDQILLEEEVYEKTRINDEKKRKDVEQFINRFRAQANKARAVQSRIKALGKKERLESLSEMKSLDFSFNPAPFTGKRLIGAEDLTFSFDPDGRPLIRGLSLTVGKRDRIAIVGKNGRGKTTLLNLLSGELLPQQGKVSHHPGLSLAYFGQTNIDRLDPEKTVEGEIMSVHPEHNRGAARNICGAMMFEGDAALKKISLLSGGEKSRVLLGKLLVSPANMLMLDEPTNHLDMESIDSLIDALDAFDGAVMIVTHSELILHAVAGRLIVFDGDEVSVFEGTYGDFLERVGWQSENSIKENNRSDRPPRPAGPSKKDLRRLRAEIISERSRTINPLQKRIADIEEVIIGLEEKMNSDTQSLLDASVKADGAAIRVLSLAIHNTKVEIGALFSELETLTSELQEKSRAFEEMLNESCQETSS